MSKTFQFGNGEWAVGKETALAYNDENSNFKPLPFTFDRGSIGTVVNKDGLIETVGVDEPRIDFLNNTKGHLLLEPSRQNIITYSEFDSASPTNWQTGFGTGTFSYDLVSYKSRPALKQRQQTEGRSHKQQNVTVSTSTTYTLSFYIDKENSINIDDNDRVCSIITSDNIGFTSKNYGDADENNRINFTFTTNTDTSIQIRIGLGSAGNVQGDKTLIFSMPQLEQGSYATSYIPTQGSAVTRSLETCEQTTPDGVIGQNEGVFYAEIKANETSNASGRRTISLSDKTNNNRVYISFDDEYNKLNIFIEVNDTPITFDNVNISNQNVYNKIAVKYKSGDSAIYVNGVLKNSFNDTFSGGVFNTLKFQNRGAGEFFNGNCKEIKVYNTALTDAELIALTS